MNFTSLSLPRGWSFDTDWKFTQVTAAALLAAPYVGTPKRAVLRYVSLGAPSASDITVVERDAVFAAGWQALGLVQHVELPHWIASPQNGQQHGAAAVAHAQLIGYPTGCHIGVDIEGLGNAGAPVQQYVSAWATEVNGAGYLTLPYDGYDDGMPAAVKLALVAAGLVRTGDWWSDFGPRVLPAGLLWALKQHSQITLGGVEIDPDEILVDNVLSFMAIDTGQPAAGGGPEQPHV
jgi:glycoside hydrolase-like protein